MAGGRSKKRAAARKAGFDSDFEWTISKNAKAAGLKVKYEPKGFVIKYQRKPARYKPDWVLPNGIIVESKGNFTARDRTKHLLIKEQHPEYDIRFLFQANNPIRKGSSTRYTDWCEQHGFQWCIGDHIPLAWAEEVPAKRRKGT